MGQDERNDRGAAERYSAEALRLPPAEVVVEQLATAAEAAEAAHGLAREMREMIGAQGQPAELTKLEFTATRPIAQDGQKGTGWSSSIGVLNPNPFPLWLSTGGRATKQGHAIAVPAVGAGENMAAIVLPIGASDVTLGVDPADVAAIDAAGGSIAWLLRWDWPQPLYVGGW